MMSRGELAAINFLEPGDCVTAMSSGFTVDMHQRVMTADGSVGWVNSACLREVEPCSSS